MNKTPRLSKSGIEYLDYQWGIFSGCHNWKNGVCPVEHCWAKSFTQRFTNIYPNGFEPTFYPEAINSPKYLKKPSLIGVGWVGDVIGYCDKVSERSLIYQTIMQCPQHTFLFLTKNPERLAKFSPFPENCWVGVTATDRRMFIEALRGLTDVRANIKFISFEPLLDRAISNDGWIVEHAPNVKPDDAFMIASAGIKWAIIGAQTKPYKPPKIEWVQEIVEAADKTGIPVFQKNNLKPLLGDNLRQEWPK